MSCWFRLVSLRCGLPLRDGVQMLEPKDLPRRGLALFVASAGGATFAIWASQLTVDLLAGRTPARLDTQMTSVTTTLDLGLIVPPCLIAAGRIWRGQIVGHVIAFPLLGCRVGLFPWIILATLFQVLAGIAFTKAEVIGPMVGFATLGLGSAWFLYAGWRGAASLELARISPAIRVTMRQIKSTTLFALIAFDAVAAVVWWQFRTDIRAVQTRVSFGSAVKQASCGAIEYADAGAGVPLLAVHGSGGGYDQGMAFAAGAPSALAWQSITLTG